MVRNLVVDGRRMRTSWFAAQMGCPGLAMSKFPLEKLMCL